MIPAPRFQREQQQSDQQHNSSLLSSHSSGGQQQQHSGATAAASGGSSTGRRSKRQPPPPHKVWVEYDLHASYTESIFESKYQIISLLGTGSFGEVFKVYSGESKSYFAIKKITKQYKNASDRDLKLREAVKHSKLPVHPNLVHFYDFWEENNCLFIKLELCSHTLCTAIENGGPLRCQRLISYMIDILSGLQVLHDQDTLHMDLKPENIFVSIGGICKIGDFGLTHDLNNDSSTAFTEGDPKYLAPEVLKQCIVSKGADIFSLGLTVIELSTDIQLPRNGELWQALRSPDEDPPQWVLDSLRPKVRPIVRLMIQYDYKMRPSCSELIKQFKSRQYKCNQMFRSPCSLLREKWALALSRLNVLVSDMCFPFRHWFSKSINTPQRPQFNVFNLRSQSTVPSSERKLLTSPQVSKNLSEKFSPLSVEKKRKEFEDCKVNLRSSFTADNEE